MSETVSAEASPRPVYRVLTWMCVGIILLLLLTGAVLALSYKGTASSSDLAAQGKRRDCVTAYNADFTEVIRARDDVKLDLDSQYYDSQLVYAQTGQRATPEVIAKFAATKAQLDKARDAVKALPKLDDAVTHGYTLNGVHHPPCPG